MKASKELKIGIFVVVVLTASFFLINYLRGEDILDREIELKGSYADLRGLVASAPVYVKGYKAGEVSEVRYVSEKDSFEVICSVLKDFKVPEDSRMVIYSVDIMGGKGVRIDYGVSETPAVDGSELETAFEQDLLGGLGESIGPLLEKVTGTLDSLSVTVSGVNKVLSDSNVASIGRTLSHLEKTNSVGCFFVSVFVCSAASSFFSTTSSNSSSRSFFIPPLRIQSLSKAKYPCIMAEMPMACTDSRFAAPASAAFNPIQTSARSYVQIPFS